MQKGGTEYQQEIAALRYTRVHELPIERGGGRYAAVSLDSVVSRHSSRFAQKDNFYVKQDKRTSSRPTESSGWATRQAAA
ncbi:hypothetical protein D3C78_512670 [compost metagenome]